MLRLGKQQCTKLPELTSITNVLWFYSSYNINHAFIFFNNCKHKAKDILRVDAKSLLN